MRNMFGSSLRVGLYRQGLTLLHVKRWRQPAVSLLGHIAFVEDISNSVRQLSAQIDQILAVSQCRHLATNVILANDLLRFCMVTPPANAIRLADCKAAADIRFQTLYGESASTWQIDADWQIRRPFLACAVPRGLLANINEMFSTCGLPLVEIAPQFIAAWNRWQSSIRPGAWFGVVGNGLVTFAALHQGNMHSVRSVPLAVPNQIDPFFLHDHLMREALRLHIPLPAEMQLCGFQPEHWTAQATDQLTFNWLDVAQKDVAASQGTALAKTGLASV
jgi:hypothetical protein